METKTDILGANGQAIEQARKVVAGVRADEMALQLALLGALAQLGWDMALSATDATDGDGRERERAGLELWSARAREAFDVWTLAYVSQGWAAAQARTRVDVRCDK